jgi:hypothetical protein
LWRGGGQPEALDGQFGDWPGQWFLLTAIVQGQEHWQGSSDLGAKFQVMWAPEGLYLAVVVEDDGLQVGPDGSNLWQGDGIEIQFDRLLDADFAESGVNDDDTQIGLAPDAMGERVRGYRWLPRAGEAPVDALGVVASAGQYGLELLVPGSTLTSVGATCVRGCVLVSTLLSTTTMGWSQRSRACFRRLRPAPPLTTRRSGEPLVLGK